MSCSDVGRRGIEPRTSVLSGLRSTTELTTLVCILSENHSWCKRITAQGDLRDPDRICTDVRGFADRWITALPRGHLLILP